MTVPTLLKIDEAAKTLGVPKQALRQVAEQFGKLVLIGQAIRIKQDDLAELIEKCRAAPKDHASFPGPARDTVSYMKSATTGTSASRPVRQTAAKLKRL
jgi:hypothetical protein